jgi:hypothetical protein
VNESESDTPQVVGGSRDMNHPYLGVLHRVRDTAQKQGRKHESVMLSSKGNVWKCGLRSGGKMAGLNHPQFFFPPGNSNETSRPFSRHCLTKRRIKEQNKYHFQE